MSLSNISAKPSGLKFCALLTAFVSTLTIGGMNSSQKAYAQSQGSAPQMGSFESLLGNLPKPVIDNGASEPATAAPPSPGMNLPQQSNSQVPPVGAQAVGGVPPEAEQKQRAEAEKQKFYQDAFDASIDSMFPLKPEEIRRFLEVYDENRQAIDTPLVNAPTPEIGVKTLSLDPGHLPESIDVAMGHVTTVTVVDVTGAVWPIKDMTWAGDFDILRPGSGESTFRIMPTSHFAKGNMSMRLVGLRAPVVLSLNTRRDKVYYRLDLRVPEYGPEANAPLIDNGLSITAGNSTLTTILDGVPPQNSETLTVDGVDSRTRAYRYNGMVYVRTPLTLLSPGWSGSVKSADGMNVYELANAPVLLLSDNGKMIRAGLSEADAE